MHLADEVLDHLLGHFEIGDHAVPHGPDSRNGRGRAPQHLLGFLADGQHGLFATHITDGHHAGLGQYNAAAADVNQSVRGAEVDRHVGGHETQQS